MLQHQGMNTNWMWWWWWWCIDDCTIKIIKLCMLCWWKQYIYIYIYIY